MLKTAWNKYKSFPVQVRASFWFLICSFLQKVISVITMPIITRLLTTTQYGQYSVFDSWLKILTIFITLQMCMGVYSQGLVKFSEDREIFSSSLQGLTIVLVSAWTVIYLCAHHFFNKLFSLTTVQMLAMLVMIWATAVFGFWSNEQRVEYKYKGLVIATLCVSLAKPVLGIIFIILTDDKVTAYILALALVELIGYVGFFISHMKRGKRFYSKKYWVYALSFNLPLVPHYLSQTVLSNADRIMIGDMIGQSEAGIYGLAYSISMIMTLFNTALSQTLSPWIYQKIKEKRVQDISNIAYLSLAIIAFVNLTLIGIAPEAVAVFAPKAYHEAIWVVPPVAMSALFMFSYDLFAKFEFYYEKTTFIMTASMIGALLNVVLNYVFINQYGYLAAGYTTLFCYIVFVFAHYVFMKRICIKYLNDVKVYNTKYLIILYCIFVTCGFALMATYNYPIIRYGVIVAVVIIVVIFRKRVIDVGKRFLSLRKKL